MADPFDLDRFVRAQDPVLDQVRRELADGRKRSHWMWFVFPQLRGLGRSATALRYGIGSLAEAKAYLAHPVLGPRLRECAHALTEHSGRTAREIDASLDLLKSQKADFVKSYLLNSEEYQTRRDDPKSYGNKGLNPVNFSYLVVAARQRGLKVAAHVETAHDLQIAALSGAAMAAHLPAYWDLKKGEDLRRRTLTPGDATIVAQSGMLLVATYAVAGVRYKAARKEGKLDEAMSARVLAVQAQNMRLLKEAGARFVAGTDGSGQIFDEVEHLVSIGALTQDEALAVALGSGKHLFPERRIGCFEEGCEADFLVLSADPSSDVSNLRKIVKRIKAGQELKAPPEKPVA